MIGQQSIADIEYANRKRKTKREKFIEIMEEVILWEEWLAIIIPLLPQGRARTAAAYQSLESAKKSKKTQIFPVSITEQTAESPITKTTDGSPDPVCTGSNTWNIKSSESAVK